MPFRAAIFDLDGTLLDTLDDIANAANHVLAARGFPTHPNLHYRTFIGEGVVKLVLRALPKTHQDEATVQACVGAYVQEYERTWNALTKPHLGGQKALTGFDPGSGRTFDHVVIAQQATVLADEESRAGRVWPALTQQGTRPMR